MPDDAKRAIWITGDLLIDHHLYEGERSAPRMQGVRGVREYREVGGACWIEHLIKNMIDLATSSNEGASPQAAPEGGWKVLLGIEPPSLADVGGARHAYSIWGPEALDKTVSNSRERVWRVKMALGYGDDPEPLVPAGRNESAAPAQKTPQDGKTAQSAVVPAALRGAHVLVLDDAASDFRDRQNAAAWLLPEKRSSKKPEWIVFKTSAPVAQGDLWAALRPWQDRLVCIVSANELRRDGAGLSAGLSWEMCSEELRDALTENMAFRELTNCRDLIVTFSSDGAFWLHRNGKSNWTAKLICDTGGAEGDWDARFSRDSSAYLSCLVAAVVRQIMLAEKSERDLDFAHAIRSGLAVIRDLKRNGLGPAAGTSPPPMGYPSLRLAKTLIGPAGSFAENSVPWPGEPLVGKTSRPWQMIEAAQRQPGSAAPPSLLGLARQVILQGTHVLKSFPYAKFGRLLTADRNEIECLRTIRRLMLTHRSAAGRRPLAIGVFGPPGAGKSFGVHEIADAIFGAEAWLEFNLSQFAGVEDLIGAFHQVRDKKLSGTTPVVFWDEFDAERYRWLQYLLAPIQDGRFQEGQVTHNIGNPVFIFAGATSRSFEEFGPPPEEPTAWQEFKLRKGPDFTSRLDAYYNVLGPNPRELAIRKNGATSYTADPTDVCYPVRRAILIRKLIGRKEDARIEWDPDLVDALLEAPKFTHGARSLEKLVVALRSTGTEPIRCSMLPPAEQLGLHVDLTNFRKLLDQNRSFRDAAIARALPAAIHKTWNDLAIDNGWTPAPHLNKAYKDLAEVDKDDNRAAAARIPEVLALAGLRLEKGLATGSHEKAVCEHILHHRERLAEAEHDGWVEHKLKNGWRRQSPRNDNLKHHPALVPYAQLLETDRAKDRDAVMHYPQMARLAGYKIVFDSGVHDSRSDTSRSKRWVR